jgi:MFS family permease
VPNPLGRAAESIAPARLGHSFRWLFASSLLTNIGDGIALAAGPLLIASQTQDPLIVSIAVLAQTIPVLLFGFLAGVVADRIDRRRLIMVLNLVRAVILVLLAVTIATDVVTIGLVMVALFAMGTVETFADVNAGSLLPRLVRREDLGVANARLQGGSLLTNQLLAPPIGALFFAVGMAAPFTINAICFAFGAVLVSRIRYRPDVEVAPPREEHHWLTEMGEGMRWLRDHAPMRTLFITIVAFNVTFGAAWGVLVLYATERLGMTAVGFGLTTTAMAIGGLVGTALYGPLERRYSLANIMRVGLLIETFTHLVLAVTTLPAVALVTLTVFGGHAFVWNTTATAVRQRAVPDELLGRVTGVYHVGVYGGIVVGTPIGGWLAQQFGITAPFWFGFIGSAILVVVLWRKFDNIVHAGDAVPHATAPIPDTT